VRSLLCNRAAKSRLGDAWKEWNGRFRDDVRSFMKADNYTIKHIAYHLTGSPDIYRHSEREPEQRSINFVTCHDGFTLNDLVSYNAKHNEANGENNCDGAPSNLSWNCGVEGLSDDPYGDLPVFRKEEAATQNRELKATVSKAIPVIEEHLEIAKSDSSKLAVR